MAEENKIDYWQKKEKFMPKKKDNQSQQDKSEGLHTANAVDEGSERTADTFNLSEKIIDAEGFPAVPSWLEIDEVREFIRLLKGMIVFELEPVTMGKSISRRLNEQIDKLAGKALT